MKKLTRQLIVVGILALGVAGLALADDDNNSKGCSLSSIQGLYLFSASGFNVIPGGMQPKAIVELFHLNGDGSLTGGAATANINGTVIRTPAGGTGSYTVAADCTGTLNFGPPANFTYDFFIAPKGAYLVMNQTGGGQLPGVLQGTADKVSR